MEAARLGAQSSHLYGGGLGELDLNRREKRVFGWDLNDWSWDSERFVAMPVPAAAANGSVMNNSPSSSEEAKAEVARNGVPVPAAAANGSVMNNSPSSSEEAKAEVARNGGVRGDSDKRKRVVVIDDDDTENQDKIENGGGALSLRIGGGAVGGGLLENGSVDEEGNGKKIRVQGGSSSGPACQVEGCGADLTAAKDYHRRHKVCEMHAKATTAVVGNAVQRFCQQCSRFHLLQEFDEGKRSCRRRLAGHNRRRRKTRPEIAIGGTASIEDKVSNYLLLSLLGICANLNSDNAEHSNGQESLSNLLRNLGTVAKSLEPKELCKLLEAVQSLQNGSNAGSSGTANALVNTAAAEADGLSNPKVPFVNGSQCGQASSSVMPAQSKATLVATPACKLKDFDLNDTCNDMEGFEDGQEGSPTPAFKAADSPNCPSWMQQDSTQSPPQTSGNSDSTSTQSLSSSNGDAQCRTDKIVFKLFEKVPSDLPPVLRSEIIGWLSSSPTDIESYIRPGCIILTVYLRLVESAWRELSDNMSSRLNKLLNSSTDNFWASGLVFVMVRHQLAFMHNGQIMLDRPLAPSSHRYCKILCVTPVAAPISATVNFRVEGFNLVNASSRLVCSFEECCFFQEDTATIAEDTVHEDRDTEYLSFCCSLPGSRGRGFIEVEDSGFSNGFFPFIIAEQDVCSEVSELESIFDPSSHEQADDDNARNQALEFLNELGWLLHRANRISKQDKIEPPLAAFNLLRFRNLGIFAMEREWCAVVKMLLDFLFIGLVDVGSQSPEEVVLSENLLHAAVQRKSVRMVRFLLRYTQNKNFKGTAQTYLFRPDSLGPSTITPLHIAAATSDAEDVLDALTDDPGLVGISAWRNARDETGLTPEDYARQRGNDAYLNLVQKKTDKHLGEGHVVLGVPSSMCPVITNGVKPGDVSLEICRNTPMTAPVPKCHLCSRQAMMYPSSAVRTFLYRPAMLTVMGVAVVCVCVGILLHTLPKVYAVPTFRWELLERGSM
ncbi:squamosa promoter-binding-like protein 6 isoform X2 [Phragmites australis]|uniref:squamosa promoter-binding-like protein 6 isoform X2 n=1 Tax=Phragmites australis TaxID=29695 RepID=UPI002D77421D|nr:squamosa promoter-binding-like protein 6 isoform X2 [Phragmites australis]